MPHPPKPITAEDFAPLHRQLVRLLADPAKAAKALNGTPELAIAAFGAIKGSPALLAEWVARSHPASKSPYVGFLAPKSLQRKAQGACPHGIR